MCNPTEDPLRTLLVELNNRSRRYATRFWQLPFGYLGTAAIAAAWVVHKDVKDMHTIAAVFFLLGLLVLWIMFGTFVAIERSVKRLHEIEEALHLPTTVKRFRLLIDLPTFLLALAVTVGAFYLWCYC